MTIKDGKWVFDKHPDLASAVRRFFEILETTEESNNGVRFHPVQISSVRIFKTAEIESLIPQIKKFLKKTEFATVHHEDSKSFYHAMLVRKMSKKEVSDESKTASGEL